jgi:hypothetical protein
MSFFFFFLVVVVVVLVIELSTCKALEPHHMLLFFDYFSDMISCFCIFACESLDCDPPTLTSQVAEVVGMYHHTQPSAFLFKIKLT